VLRKTFAVLVTFVCTTVLLTGCGIGPAVRGSRGTLALRGLVHGGQQPVKGSSIQLYTVGSAGNASASTPMVGATITTDEQGNFDITGDYTCGDSSSGTPISAGSNQVYIVARGGNPGLKAGTDNAALVLVAALGPCVNLANMSYVEINEVTTVAMAWALAPFMTSSVFVGASPTNADGIENAFLNAGLLADTATGMAATLHSNQTIEMDKLYALADAIASCVNSDGTTGCGPLFTAATPTGGKQPTTTLQAALNIVKHPGENVAKVFGAIGDVMPFPTSYTAAPNDWTMSLTVTGGGLFSPTALAIDQASNVWVTAEDGPLSSFGPQGVPLSDTGYGVMNDVPSLTQTFGLTVDSDGDIWITNFNALYKSTGSIVEFYGSNAAAPNATGDPVAFPGPTGGISYPTAVASDGNHNVYVANNGNGTATVYNSSGALVSSSLGPALTQPGEPLGIAVDSTGGFWLPDSAYGVEHVSKDGATLLSYADCCYNSYGVATDASGNAWVTNYLDSSFSEVSKAGSTLLYRISGGGVTLPHSVVVDAAQNVWIANWGGRTISEIAGSARPAAAGTAISPTSGVYGTGGYGLDINLVEPAGISPDRAGDVWVESGGTDSVVMFFGLSTPTVTPIQPVPTAP
jgi:hypothetical protein